MIQTDFSDFSLLFPDAATKRAHYEGKARARIDDFTLEELGLTEVLPLKNSDLSEFITADPAVILYRQGVFGDMLAHEEIGATISRLMPILFDIMELRRLQAEGNEGDDYLSSMTEIELYIASVDILYRGIGANREKFQSTAFSELAAYIAELVESEYYKELNERLAELTRRVREIKSVTIGVNLDAQLRPREAGVLAINAESFRSGDTLQKILHIGERDDRFTCIAALTPFGKKQSENQKTALSMAFHSAINEVYRQSLRSWKRIVREYVLDNTDFLLSLLPEFEFLQKGTNLLRALQIKGNVISLPKICPAAARVFRATALYNPAVALKVEGAVVTNDFAFDEKAAIFVLTGPNRGGKSVITCAVGLCKAMAQLGLPVPAAEAELSPVDGIFTHFPTGADDTIDKGRLGEECARLGEIFDLISAESLVLLDESLSSTGSFEASYIAAEVLAGLSRVGCHCLFSTHLHELASSVPEINARSVENGGVRIDTLVAGIEEGKRSFKIHRMRPDGKSYARDIADKYGLSFENLMGGAKENK